MNEPSRLTITDFAQLTGRSWRFVRDRLRNLPPIHRDRKSVYYDPDQALPLILAPAESDVQAQRARLFAMQADKVAMQVATLRRRLRDPVEVREHVERHMAEVKKRVAAISDRGAGRILAIPLEKRTLGQVREILDDEVRAALTELSADYPAPGKRRAPADEHNSQRSS